LREFIWASELHWVKITTNAEGGRLVANGRRNDGNYDESGPGEVREVGESEEFPNREAVLDGKHQVHNDIVNFLSLIIAQLEKRVSEPKEK